MEEQKINQEGTEQHQENDQSNIVKKTFNIGDHERMWAVVAYFIFFLPLLTDKKDEQYVKFHVKQGLVLLISFIIQMFMSFIPVLGLIAAPILLLINIILLIIGIVNAATGKQKRLPLVGKIADNFRF